MLRTLRALALPLVMALTLGSQAMAQNGSLTLSTPKKDGTDIVTVRFKRGPETTSVEVKVPVTKGMNPAEKAKKFEEALEKKLEEIGQSDAIDVQTNGNDLEFTPKDGVELKSLKLTGATGERDRWSAANFFEGDVLLTGAIKGLDGFGEPSVLSVGTDRGVVEVSLAQHDSVESAMKSVLLGLADFGIQAELTESNRIALSLDDADGGIVFECTDMGMTITTELSAQAD